MTQYVNPLTRNGGVEQIVVPERAPSPPVDEAPFDDKQYVRVNGVWVPIVFPAPPDPTPADIMFVSNGTTFTTTSTSGVAMGSSGAQGVFEAPPSGELILWVSGQAKASVDGQPAAISFEVREGLTIGSGTTVVSKNIDRAFLNAGTQYVRGSMPYTVDGLTPGDDYNVRTIAFSGSGSSTASVGRCVITLQFQP